MMLQHNNKWKQFFQLKLLKVYFLLNTCAPELIPIVDINALLVSCVCRHRKPVNYNLV